MEAGRGRRFLLALALVAAASAAAPTNLEADGEHVAVPSYWNPDAAPDKPDLRTLGAIRFVTTDDYPPFGFALADGTAAGFEVDLARALCAELQKTCTIQARAWEAILPALANGQADAAIASLAIAQGKGVRFTAAYYKTPARFVVRLPSPFAAVEPATMAGKRVGVVDGTAHQAYLTQFFPRALAASFPTIEAARAALKGGTVDAVFGDAVAWSIWLNGTDAAGCCAFAGGPYTESRFFGRGAGIAVREDDTALREALDYALARVAAKGIYGDIYLRYFPVGFY